MKNALCTRFRCLLVPWLAIFACWSHFLVLHASEITLPFVDVPKRNLAEVKQMLRCLEDKYNPASLTWEMAMQNTPASLQVAGVWRSSKATQNIISVVTQLSMSRLEQLQHQCETWEGPLSAVIYIAVVQPNQKGLTDKNAKMLRDAAVAMDEFFWKVDKSERTKCGLRLLLVYERLLSDDVEILYPVNSLRNLARLQADTPLIAMLDIDLVISGSLAKEMKSTKAADRLVELCSKGKSVIVLPAFEIKGRLINTGIKGSAAFADEMAQEDSKKVLKKHYDSGVVTMFNAGNFAQGHQPTNYSRWFQEDNIYRIAYEHHYEPWVVVDRKSVPWHDTRFRGYGRNKIVQIAAMRYESYTFRVHPTAFVVHRNHIKSDARKIYTKERTKQDGPDFAETIRGHNREIYEVLLNQMRAGTYQAMTDPQIDYCINMLDWWKNKKEVRSLMVKNWRDESSRRIRHVSLR